MVLLINLDINRYIPAKSVKHNICYFKYAFKLQLGYLPQRSFLSPKSPTPLRVLGFDLCVCSNLYYIFYLFASNLLTIV